MSQVENSAGIIFLPDALHGCYRRSEYFDADDSPQLEKMSAWHSTQFLRVPTFFSITEQSSNSLHIHNSSDDDHFDGEELPELVNISSSSNDDSGDIESTSALYYLVKYLIKCQPGNGNTI